jgi:cellulose synthase/poly-beta-1,6-N-acetylglucosamine synthase-like glycosyltransferase
MFVITLSAILLIAVYGGLIAFYLRAWKAIPVYAPAAGAARPGTTLITVLVPARNEENNIIDCLESLSRQTYPPDLYEVIVIDDHSTDGTAAAVKAFARGGRPFSVVLLDLAEAAAAATTEAGAAAVGSGAAAVKAHKKFAIERGVRAAKGDLIVTTDADCRFHPDWLLTMGAFYEERGAKFIAAPVRIAGKSGLSGDSGLSGKSGPSGPSGESGLSGESGSLGPGSPGRNWLTIFQTLDFITLQGITGAAVGRRFHSMCNGANLAYAREAFFEAGGYRGIDALPSGDDMLLMHKIYLQYPERVFFLKSPRVIVDTRPETSWGGFVNQRVRWASKADSYEDRRIFWVLLMVYLVNLLFAGLLVAGFWNSWWWWVGLLLLVVKTAVEYPFVRGVAGFFRQRRLMPYFPLLQPVHIVYTIVIGAWGKFGSYRWKGRTIRKILNR